MEQSYNFTVSVEYQGFSLYQYLEQQMVEYAPSTIKKMLHNGLVRVFDEVGKSDTRLNTGNKIYVIIPHNLAEEYPSEPRDMEILFENEEFLVVNKPSGISVAPERWLKREIFRESLLSHLEETNQDDCAPHLIHRIDKEASGLVLVAKTQEMARYLSLLFEKRNIHKEYLILVAGVPPETGRIELKIAPASKHSPRMIISEFGKVAVTNYKVIEAFTDFALLDVNIETGRTHQIRVHMASQGYPLAVDSLYGYRASLQLSDLKPNYRSKKDRKEKPLISRLTLHAHRLTFPLPGTDQPFTIEAPLHKDFNVVLKMLRKYRTPGKGKQTNLPVTE